MNYKKLFKTSNDRAKMLRKLRFVPDKLMLRMQYRIKLHRGLHLRKPVRFTEKLQWYKLHYRNPVMRECVDKYAVREYVKSKGLEDTLVRLYGRYDSVDDIDWDALPNSFVMKTTHGGGGLSVAICRDKSTHDIERMKRRFRFNGTEVESDIGGREWAYYGIKKAIVIEELLVNEQDPEAGINDYKLLCYGGKPEYIIVDVDRYIGHKRNFYDTDWNDLHITSDCPAIDRKIEKPGNLEEMLRVASILSKDFPFVRVDLYNVGGRIYFGELTFYPWSGYVQFDPDKYDFDFGKEFELRKYRPDEIQTR
ncbi:MAG: carbonic anhydrase [Clostridia bacterium]|nr:carbonic anhydrase [Clostridia bacterium]